MARARNQRDPYAFFFRYQNVGENILNRNNGLYFVIGALVVVIVGLGAYIFNEERKPDGIELRIGQNGISVEEK
ncbi:hypothetical protein RGR602_CH01423 [Rhizobium gallicum bv. gallicum R602sp]|uniref:Uncharacterized protein n=1 Tax=Rhizobium gallicum bv. gallicum R602sp TaxID=1041138 RepID=A0A0B4WYM0_9HYPH|nr:hypothetical protein RGR602_CH01423 [Rhizobium gallicum bv. gallicum R602sp]